MASYYNEKEEGGNSKALGYGDINSSEEPSAESSRNHSRPGSPRGKGRERGRVRFNSNSEVNDVLNKRSSFPIRDKNGSDSPSIGSPVQTPKLTRTSPTHTRTPSNISDLAHSSPKIEGPNPFSDSDIENLRGDSALTVKKPRPAMLRNNSASSALEGFTAEEQEEAEEEKVFSALAAQERAQRNARLVGSHSAPGSRRTSLEADDFGPPRPRLDGRPAEFDDIPLMDMGRREYDGPDTESDEDYPRMVHGKSKFSATSEAHKLVRQHTVKNTLKNLKFQLKSNSGLVSGQVTPTEEQNEEYVPRPQEFRGGVLSSLLKLYNNPNESGHGRKNSSGGASVSPSQATTTPGSSGTNTPRSKQTKWYNQKNQSKDTLATLIEASAMLSGPAGGSAGGSAGSRPGRRPGIGVRSHSARLMGTAMGRSSRPALEDEIRITVHIAETLSRQKYLIRLCRALMSYGAPTHRLEEYMKMSARVLEIDGQFLYIPGCMLISFDDASTHTTEVKLVKTAQGVDLGKLKDVHDIYKEVVHDVIGVEEATQRLDTVISKPPKHKKWVIVLLYGLASASVAPFAFQGRLIDLPIAFLLGSILGIMQHVIAPTSDLYSNVFEVSASVFTSFLARAFGSIPHGDGYLFCFSALAQSSIALILPGYMVLCGSLELQSRSMVAGSVRMVYAIIYSLFLGFGITVGTVIYGLMDSNATYETTCSNTMSPYWNFLFVPIFALCLSVINQAKWKQTPIMLLIALVGYVVNFFSARKFPSNAQISNTLGALAIGAMGNLYSRLGHGLAAAAMLPAIFVQVPSGLAASGSLLAGLSEADEITNSTTYPNGTAKINGTSSVTISSTSDLNSVVFNVGYSMIQIAIGITVGLFLSALLVYPLGKRRSGLFSF